MVRRRATSPSCRKRSIRTPGWSASSPARATTFRLRSYSTWQPEIRPDTGNYQSLIVSITQVGDAATATVAEEGYWGTVSFVDFFSLCRFSGTKIVNKTFAHVGGEPPS